MDNFMWSRTPRALLGPRNTLSGGDPNSRSSQSLGMWSSRWHRCSLQPAWPPRHAAHWVNNLHREHRQKAWGSGRVGCSRPPKGPSGSQAGVGRGAGSELPKGHASPTPSCPDSSRLADPTASLSTSYCHPLTRSPCTDQSDPPQAYRSRPRPLLPPLLLPLWARPQRPSFISLVVVCSSCLRAFAQAVCSA